jgi:hypothetical protein
MTGARATCLRQLLAFLNANFCLDIVSAALGLTHRDSAHKQEKCENSYNDIATAIYILANLTYPLGS